MRFIDALMKLVILIILPIYFLFQQDFYAKVVNDLKRYGPFIAVPVKTKKYRGTMVTENNDLYVHYLVKRRWTSGQYVPYMHLKVVNRDTIQLPDEYIDEGEGYITPALEVDSSMSVDKITDLYFFTPAGTKIFKEGISHAEQRKVVRWLFEHKVECRTDDETGLIYIPSERR